MNPSFEYVARQILDRQVRPGAEGIRPGDLSWICVSTRRLPPPLPGMTPVVPQVEVR